MNCYGTNPRFTQPVQSVNNMNTMNTFPMNQPPMTSTQNTFPRQNSFPMQNPHGTTTSGEWSHPIPTNPDMPTSPASVPINPSPLPPTLTEPIYTPGFLSMHIGDLVRVEFLIGNQTTDRVGRLRTVGASFIVLDALDGGSEIMCDIFSIRFVTIIQSSVEAQLLGSF